MDPGQIGDPAEKIAFACRCGSRIALEGLPEACGERRRRIEQPDDPCEGVTADDVLANIVNQVEAPK